MFDIRPSSSSFQRAKEKRVGRRVNRKAESFQAAAQADEGG
jgi:hypothetical protein